jgi:hypothetical protein
MWQKMCIYVQCRIFLSNYWWQKSDIWSQASYRYPISWEAFVDPSDSYFLFADLVDFYTHWTYMLNFRHIFLSNYWWQKSDIWSNWRVKKRFPRYGVPIWSLWPNIRFLPSIVAEKNATRQVWLFLFLILRRLNIFFSKSSNSFLNLQGNFQSIHHITDKKVYVGLTECRDIFTFHPLATSLDLMGTIILVYKM